MRPRHLIVTTTLLAALTGCGSSGSPAPGGADTSPATSPAASGTSAPSSTGVTHADPAPHNAADTMFTQMMIVHHQGAVDMSELAAERASSPEVKRLAAAIAQAQGPEIEQMTAWLQAWGEPTESAHHGTGHTQDESMLMNGKTHEQVMAELEGLKGDAFDTAFLKAMIPHHEGAVTMSEDVLKDGQNPDVKALARTIIDSQQREIEQMKGMLPSS